MIYTDKELYYFEGEGTFVVMVTIKTWLRWLKDTNIDCQLETRNKQPPIHLSIYYYLLGPYAEFATP